jgi:hypothetical protein
MSEMPEEIFAAMGKDGATYWVRDRHDALDRRDSMSQTRYTRTDLVAAKDAEIAELKADRDSWIDQTEDARDHAIKRAAENDKLVRMLAEAKGRIFDLKNPDRSETGEFNEAEEIQRIRDGLRGGGV